MHIGEVSGGKDSLLPVHILVFSFLLPRRIFAVLLLFRGLLSAANLRSHWHPSVPRRVCPSGRCEHLASKWHFPQVGQDGGGVLLAL
jgi:hypothetical protein